MATKIDTVSARDKLKARREPHWHRVAKGAYLGYRKMSAGPGGSWVARMLDEATGGQKYHALGDFSDKPDNSRFDLAQAAARDWFAHMGRGGSNTSITVRKACGEYVEHLRNAKRKEGAATDADGRFKRWIYCNVKLSGTPVEKLTMTQVSTWRATLAKTQAIHPDKTKQTNRERTSSALNRDMATFRAALNLALENGHCTTDQPWKTKLKTIKGATGRRDVYLDLGQRRALIAAAAPAFGAFLRGLSMLPLRPGALAALTVGNFNRGLGVLTVGKDKSGKDRQIGVKGPTAAFFVEQCKDKLPGAPIFAQATGRPWHKDAWKDPFKAAAVIAELPPNATAYTLRHSTITDLISVHRTDLLTVAQLSGTSLEMIDKHYGHLLKEHGADALALLAL